jgi:hypothetical protein
MSKFGGRGGGWPVIGALLAEFSLGVVVDGENWVVGFA